MGYFFNYLILGSIEYYVRKGGLFEIILIIINVGCLLRLFVKVELKRKV